MPERLQKFLARSGIGSRRFCENLIKSNEIFVSKTKFMKLREEFNNLTTKINKLRKIKSNTFDAKFWIQKNLLEKKYKTIISK